MKTILITGKTGYVATQLAGYLARWPERYSIRTLSLREEGWERESFSDVDVLIHTAALVHDARMRDDPAQLPRYRQINRDLTLRLGEKAKADGVGQFLFMSTAGVYGIDGKVGETVIIDENTPLNPKNNYGISKLEAEQGLLKLKDDRFRVAILRPPMIYGKGCKGNYVTLAALAKKLPVFPLVENQRSMLYMENLAEFVRLLIDDGAEGIFCPQNEEYTNTSRMVARIATLSGKKIWLIPGFTWAVKLLGRFTSLAEKAFGSWCYHRALSDYPKNYCVKSLKQSLEETEG